jgi:hypothetical protein
VSKKLGNTQLIVLQDLERFGAWYEGCGWTWNNASGTTRIMESLFKRGLVTKEVGKGPYPRVTYTLKED